MANYLLAGGGTGGHIYPGFAVAEAILARDPLARVDFACTTRPIDGMILKNWPGQTLIQPIHPFSVRPWGFIKFYRGWWKTRSQIRHWLRDNRTVAVLGLGGFGSGAAVYEGARLGLRTAFLNPDFVPGRANQWLSKSAGKIFVQWVGTQEYFDRPVDAVGVPLRKSISGLAGNERANLRQEGLKEFDLRPDRKTLVIMGGSTGARSLNAAVVKVLNELSGQMAGAWQVLHITGTGDFDSTKVAYSSGGDLTLKVFPYSCRMDLAWALADLAICRAGAITLAELTAVAIPSILLPYPYHRDNHQAKNGNVLAQAGAAVMIEDDKVAGPATVDKLRETLRNIIQNEAVRQKMVEGAKTLQRVDAAEKVARWLMGQ